MVQSNIYEVLRFNLHLPLLLVVLESHTIITVLQLVLGHPLTVVSRRPTGVVISSLRCYTCYFGITQKNL